MGSWQILVLASLFALVSGNFHGHQLHRSREIFLHDRIIDSRVHPEFTEDEAHLVHVERFSQDTVHTYMVHLLGPITGTVKSRVQSDLKITFLDYLPHNTFLVSMTEEKANEVKLHKDVMWVGSFKPEYKIQQYLQDWEKNPVEYCEEKKAVASLFTKLPANELSSLTQRWENELQSIPQLAGSKISTEAHLLVIEAPSHKKLHSLAVWLADKPEVRWIEPKILFTPLASNNEAVTIVLGSAEDNFKNRANSLTGADVTIAIGDTGLNNQSCFFPTGKVKQYINTVSSGNSIIQGDYIDNNGHGTAVAGIISGNSSDAEYSPYNGIAPNSNLLIIDLTSSDIQNQTSMPVPLTFDSYFNLLVDLGATIVVNAIGPAIAKSSAAPWYSTQSKELDSTLNFLTGLLSVTPAGNDGLRGAGYINVLGIAKNTLTVGASETTYAKYLEKNSATKVKAPLIGENVMLPISSYGPTNDFRIKPEVVAPGLLITVPSLDTCGTGLSGVTTTSIANSTNWGTSYSAALAAGAGALVAEWLAKGYYPQGENPSNDNTIFLPAKANFLKAFLIAAGVPMYGKDANGTSLENPVNFITFSQEGPSPYYGFGRINMSESIFLSKGNSSTQIGNEIVIAGINDADVIRTGESMSTCFSVTSSARKIKATLVYTDTPALENSGIAIVDDLDLVLVNTGTGQLYHANGLQTYDSSNNVEQVVIKKPDAGLYKAIVYGMNVVSDTGRSFALVVNGDLNGVSCTTKRDTLKCPNDCSGAGTCSSSGDCVCQSSRYGPDCSISKCSETCTKNLAFFSGYCNTQTGTCACLNGKLYENDCKDPSSSGIIIDGISYVIIPGNEGLATGLVVGLAIFFFLLGAIPFFILGYILAKKHLEKQRQKRKQKLLEQRGATA